MHHDSPSYHIFNTNGIVAKVKIGNNNRKRYEFHNIQIGVHFANVCSTFLVLNAIWFVNDTNSCIRSTKGHSCLNNSPDFSLGIERFQRLQIG